MGPVHAKTARTYFDQFVYCRLMSSFGTVKALGSGRHHRGQPPLALRSTSTLLFTQGF